MNERERDWLGWATGALAFALLMQFRPFRWTVYLGAVWLAFLAIQDWWSEHELPAGSSSYTWGIDHDDLMPVGGEQQRSYAVTGWFWNHGREGIERAVLKGRLYACDRPDDPLDRCVPEADAREPLQLQTRPGFRTHFTAYVHFSGAGGANPRLVWSLAEVVADDDWPAELGRT